jgi:hypothetical protein
MSLRYHLRSRDPNPSGKFQHHRRPGIASGRDHTFGGWSYRLIEHHTGTTVKRTVYNASVADPNGSRAIYLQGFTTAERAATAAQEWIDQQLNDGTRATPNQRKNRTAF